MVVEGVHVIEVDYWEGVEPEKVVAEAQQGVEAPKKEVEMRMMAAAVVGLLLMPMRVFGFQEVEEVSCQLEVADL